MSPFARRAAGMAAALAVASASVVLASPAQAAGRVTVDAEGRGAVIDRTYSTTLTVKGRGFQSIKGGHGGVYVWFGTVKGDWRPSKGGRSGVDYVYVPDSETKDNAGFQRYVAFPGSNTASAANGGTMDAQGSWSTRLVVPGPTFEAVGRNGSTTTVDCRKVTCGVITIGAHGVSNGNNETFTPVDLADLGASAGGAGNGGSSGGGPAGGSTGVPAAGDAPTVAPSDAPPTVEATPRGPATLSIDHASAVAGRAMSFRAENLVPGEQFTLVLDDGMAAVGPFLVGDDGSASGVLGLPAELGAGTHEIRVFGSSKEAALKFGVQSDATSTDDADLLRDRELWFVVAAAVVFLLALGLTVARFVRGRRALR